MIVVIIQFYVDWECMAGGTHVKLDGQTLLIRKRPDLGQFYVISITSVLLRTLLLYFETRLLLVMSNLNALGVDNLDITENLIDCLQRFACELCQPSNIHDDRRASGQVLTLGLGIRDGEYDRAECVGEDEQDLPLGVSKSTICTP